MRWRAVEVAPHEDLRSSKTSMTPTLDTPAADASGRNLTTPTERDNAEAALRREIKMAEETEQRRRARPKRLGDPDE